MKQLQSILTDLDNKAITKHQAYDLILVLFDVSTSVCLHEPQYQSYNSETKLQICDKCGAITN